MKVIIAGGRDYQYTEQDLDDLDRLHRLIDITEEVSGTAGGADRFGEVWAGYRNVPVRRFPAEWEKYRDKDKSPGKKNPAGAIRNRQMAQYVGSAGAVVLFPGGRGTQNMFDQAKKHGLRIFDWRKEPREFPEP